MATVEIPANRVPSSAPAPLPPQIPLPCETELLSEAKTICRDQLAKDANQPDLLNLRGLLAAKDGQHELAWRCFARAVELAPDNAEYLLDLAKACTRVGRDDEGISALLTALRCDPDCAETYLALARAHHRQGRSDEAITTSEECLRRCPDDATCSNAQVDTRVNTRAEASAEIGDVLRDRGQWAEAIEQYERCLASGGGMTPAVVASLHLRIGRIRLSRRESGPALEAFHEGLRADESHADLHVGLGQALMSRGELAEAVASFREALNIDTMHADAASQLVCALELLGRTPDAVRAWVHLGKTLEARDKFEEAAIAFKQALARKADCLEALLRLADVSLMLGQPAEAIRHLRAALAIDPNHGVAHFRLGWALQLVGETDAGWDELAWWCHPHRIKAWRVLEQPMWDGSDIAGKTIFLWAGLDYGLGDSIHLARFARHVKRLGARVVVESQRELTPLFVRMPGVDRAIPRHSPLPAFDLHAPFMLVPIVDRAARALRATDVPYLTPDESRMTHWRERLAPLAGKKIGLCWGGQTTRKDARFRFVPLSTFIPFSRIPNISLVSLQIGPQADELVCPLPELQIAAILGDDPSMDDTAALIASLDLVITVDTMIANLAGALGQPVWTLVPFAGDWKWATGDETPWYPSMRLFRQSRQGDWTGAIERVREALATFAAD